MSVKGSVFLLLFSAFVLYVGITINNILKVPPKPSLPNTWWGKGPPKEDDKSIKPFKINISQEVLDDLQVRLKNHRQFLPPLEGIAQQYGMNTILLKEVVQFWRTKYNWREREKFLNKFPQFKTQVQGLDIHFIHVKPASNLPKNVRVIPLLLLHGWPGSVREFYDLMPLLTTARKDRDFVFEVVVPSLPGYGFSEGASRPGCGPAQIANIFKNLMLRLGHERFYVQGGDWGSLISSIMATLFPEHVIGMHANMCSMLFNSISSFKIILGSFYPPLVVDKEHEDLMYPLSKVFSFSVLESGYLHIQATKPDTIDDLKRRLENHRPFVPPLETVQHQYGMNTKLLERILEFWKNSYSWKERESYLNKFPQFVTQIQGLNIHFLHVKPSKSKDVRILPLLLLHGWPGSVREFYDIIPMLTTPHGNKDFVFEIVAPSLPGYGFSEGTSRPGLGPAQIAIIMKNLMLRLGFKEFYVQGGDWGAIISSAMSILSPENVLGMHSNLCFVTAVFPNLVMFLGSLFPRLIIDKKHEDLMYPLSNMYQKLLLETGYLHLQATKPDTIGVALNDSPVGLAAYILEKFTTWTNASWKERVDGGLQEKFSYTDLLDNVMIYWVTGSITTSVRLYSEGFSKATMALQLDSIPVEVPVACARFRNELVYTPDSLLKYKYPMLLHSSDYDDGGHFAAFEVPKVLADDVWIAVQKIENYYKTKEKKQ